MSGADRAPTRIRAVLASGATGAADRSVSGIRGLLSAHARNQRLAAEVAHLRTDLARHREPEHYRMIVDRKGPIPPP